mgnify:CR=1 FL=1
MATVSRAYIRQFAERHTALTDSMRERMERVLAGVDTSDRVAIYARVFALLQPYTDMASALAAQFYNGIRRASGLPDDYEATAVNSLNADFVWTDVNSVLDEVDDGRNTVPRDKLISDVAGGYMKDASDNSVRANARRDPSRPRYAMVPNSDACAFCVMRASLGYHYPEKQRVKSHHSCTCVPVPVFGDAKVEGYDPQAYLDQYEEAARALRSGNLPKELEERLEREKSEKGSEFDRTKQILMVMRYQQGIS